MKRRWYLGIIMAALALVVFGCAPAPAPPAPAAPAPAPPAAAPAVSPEDAEWAKVIEASRREGKVMLYTFLFTEELPKSIKKVFEAKYPWIKLEFMPMASSTRLERIKAEQRAGSYIADTSDGSAAFQWNLKLDGMSQPVGYLPNLKDPSWIVDPKMDEKGYLIGVRGTVSGLWYNSTLLKAAEAPRSFNELLDSKWKGKVIAAHPGTSSVMPWHYAVYTSLGILDDGHFRKLGPQLKFVIGSTRDITRAVARGEAPLGLVSSADAAGLVAEGAPLKPIDVEEGARVSVSPISMINNAPHPNATKVFVNWLLSKEGQETIGKAGGFSPLRRDVPDFTPEAARITYTKLHNTTVEHMVLAEQIFASRKLVEMWGLK